MAQKRNIFNSYKTDFSLFEVHTLIIRDLLVLLHCLFSHCSHLKAYFVFKETFWNAYGIVTLCYSCFVV